VGFHNTSDHVLFLTRRSGRQPCRWSGTEFPRARSPSIRRNNFSNQQVLEQLHSAPAAYQDGASKLTPQRASALTPWAGWPLTAAIRHSFCDDFSFCHALPLHHHMLRLILRCSTMNQRHASSRFPASGVGGRGEAIVKRRLLSCTVKCELTLARGYPLLARHALVLGAACSAVSGPFKVT